MDFLEAHTFPPAAPARTLEIVEVTGSGIGGFLSPMKTSLKCSCGQRVARRDVMQQGFYMQHVSPSFVYVKFRCSRCKKLGQQFVKQEEWEDGLLNEATTEHTTEEQKRFAEMGSISLEEMKQFHLSLERADSVRELLTDETG